MLKFHTIAEKYTIILHAIFYHIYISNTERSIWHEFSLNKYLLDEWINNLNLLRSLHGQSVFMA